MKLRSVIDLPCGLRYCFESLDLGSSFSRKSLLDMEMMGSVQEVKAWQDQVRVYSEFISGEEAGSLIPDLVHHFSEVKDIRETLAAVRSGRGVDDIELFEIKSLSMNAMEIAGLLIRGGLRPSISPALEEVTAILDPDGMKIHSFYVYDAYSPQLASMRAAVRCETDMDRRQDLINAVQEIEDGIRTKLVQRLSPYCHLLEDTLKLLVSIDILLAQARLSAKLKCCEAQVTDTGIYHFEGLFNPEIDALLNAQEKSFQRLDISFGNRPLLIIGSNMGGKTVCLKTLVLSQFLLQFGFGIPARLCVMSVKKAVFFCSGDAQDEMAGLSSFGAEMKRINEIFSCHEAPRDMIAFIDEPARSTNPIEGSALVSSLVNILNDRKITLLLTTHYNVGSPSCRRLKVRGMENGKMNYRLEDSPQGEVPQEAIKVARSLGICEEWLCEANKILEDDAQ